MHQSGKSSGIHVRFVLEAVFVCIVIIIIIMESIYIALIQLSSFLKLFKASNVGGSFVG